MLLVFGVILGGGIGKDFDERCGLVWGKCYVVVEVNL